jgi:hypothetical protein
MNGRPAGPDETFGPDANTVADGFAAALHEMAGSMTIVPGGSWVA